MAAETPGGSTASIGSFGGRDVHWTEQQGSDPVVLLIGGCGVPSDLWDDLVHLLPDLHILLFDRPGMAGTRWPGKLPSLAAEVATLAGLIDAAGGPAVVVGHSMGGPHAEALARQFPELVAGLVLVDSSVDWQPRPPADTEGGWLGGSERGWLWLARLSYRGMKIPGLRMLGPAVDRLLTAVESRRRTVFSHRLRSSVDTYRSPDTVAMVLAELGSYRRQIWDLFGVRGQHPLPSLPVVVLTASADGGEKWVIVQSRLARLLGGRQVVLADSRHLMMLDRPEVIAEAIRTLH